MSVSRSVSQMHSTPLPSRRILRACALLPCLLGSSQSAAFTGTSTLSSFQLARSLSTSTTTTATATATAASTSTSNDDTNNKNPNLLADVTFLQNSYFCLRHGQSLANVEGRIASNPAKACTSSGLSELGHQQAIQAGRDVVAHYQQQQKQQPSYDGLLILSSDLLRADQTANHVLQAALAAGIPVYTGSVVTEIRLRERWFGDYDDTSDANYENVWKDDLIDPSHCLSNVESVDSVMERATQCILDWDDSSDSGNGVQNHCVVCVAHGDVLQILQTAFQKLHGSQHRSLEHLETATLRPVLLASATAKLPSSSS
jgi:broad specificity phosphatase PhoE